MTPDQRAAIFDEMNRVIAALHRVDFTAAGLTRRLWPSRWLPVTPDHPLDQTVPRLRNRIDSGDGRAD